MSFSVWQAWFKAMHAPPATGTNARRPVAAAAASVATILVDLRSDLAILGIAAPKRDLSGPVVFFIQAVGNGEKTNGRWTTTRTLGKHGGVDVCGSTPCTVRIHVFGMFECG